MIRSVRTMVLLVAGAVATVTSARADVQPGEVITAENVDQVKDLISPGLEWVVRQGMRMKIIEPRNVNWPKAYREATEKYSGQVKLGARSLSMKMRQWVSEFSVDPPC